MSFGGKHLVWHPPKSSKQEDTRLLWMSSLPIAMTGEREPDPSKMRGQLCNRKAHQPCSSIWTQIVLGIPANKVPSLNYLEQHPKGRLYSLYSHEPIAPSILSKGRRSSDYADDNAVSVPLRMPWSSTPNHGSAPRARQTFIEYDHSAPSSCIICPKLKCRPHQQGSVAKGGRRV